MVMAMKVDDDGSDVVVFHKCILHLHYHFLILVFQLPGALSSTIKNQ